MPSRSHVSLLIAVILAVVFIILGLLLVSAFALFNILIIRDDMLPLELEVARSLRLPLLAMAITVIAGGAWIGMAWKDRDACSELRRIGVSYIALYVVILAIVMPQFAPTKTYAPQGQWIRSEIGPHETHIGMVYPGGRGVRKRGAFGYETGGAMVDLLEAPEQVEEFFERYPDSIVLVQEDSVNMIFSSDTSGWRSRVQRELWVGKTLYLVVRSAPID